MPLRRALALLAAATLLGTGVAGCAGRASGAGDGRLPVVAAFYPLQYVAERVGGDRVAVTNLVQPGAEPHDLELRPRQMAAVADARLVVYLRGFQPAVDEAVDQEAGRRALDVTTATPLTGAAPQTGGHEGGAGPADAHHSDDLAGRDPHVWLDPTRLAAIGDRVAERLATVDPARAAGYRARAAALRADLTVLDKQYSDGLARCARRDIVTSHAAFGYLAARYGLTQVPISGLSPEAEPSPRRLTEVAELARAKGATTIFFETLVSPKTAELLAAHVGARAEVLDPVEGLQPGSNADYVSVMRANLVRLRTALGCA